MLLLLLLALCLAVFCVRKSGDVCPQRPRFYGFLMWQVSTFCRLNKFALGLLCWLLLLLLLCYCAVYLAVGVLISFARLRWFEVVLVQFAAISIFNAESTHTYIHRSLRLVIVLNK